MNTRIGVILGTGFNISILMPEAVSDRDQTLDRELTNQRMWQSYNTEIGSFGTNSDDLSDIITCYDSRVHNGEMSVHKGEQIFEKMISGKYLGELFR